jgi:hypothetical protein
LEGKEAVQYSDAFLPLELKQEVVKVVAKRTREDKVYERDVYTPDDIVSLTYNNFTHVNLVFIIH